MFRGRSRSGAGAGVLGLGLLLSVVPAVAEEGPDTDLARRLEAVVPADFWGAVLVARGDRVLFARGYGIADEAGQPVTIDSLFDIGSVSKQFTAAAILKLEEQGRLAVSDPIGKHLAQVPDDKQDITIHHLLTHTSGLPVDIPFTDVERKDRDAMVARVLAADLEEPPGRRFVYNNIGYFVLAAIVERASGTSFEAYLRVHVFGAAGMRDSGFVADPTLDRRKQTARVWRNLRGTVLDYPWNWTNRGATGVVTTVRDLWTWHRALRGGRVLSFASTARMLTPGPGSYGYGWFVDTTGSGSTRYRHGGATCGYRASFARYPHEDACIAVTTNGDTQAERVALLLEGVLLADEGDPLRDPATPVEELVEALADPDLATRRNAIEVLRLREDVPPAFAPALVAALETPGLNQGDASRLAALLGRMGAEAIPALLEGTRSDRWWVRGRCASILGVIGQDAARVAPALVHLLDDEQLDVRYFAACAVTAFPDAAREVLPKLRAVAARLRAEFGDTGERMARLVESRLPR